jgi:kynurenine formamidase
MELPDMKVYDLEQPRSKDMPFHPTHRVVGYTYLMHRKHRDVELAGPTRSGASGILVTTEHSGTHIDALCHQAVNHKLFGGIQVNSTIETPYGFSVLGIETVEPLVGRGLLLDIASLNGGLVEKRHRITVEELKACCEKQNIHPREGDIVLVRTGFDQLWNDENGYLEAAGVSIEGSEWLAALGVAAVGADNMAFEVDDGEIDPVRKISLPCHALLLVENGIHIIENLNLEKLASDTIYESLFVCTPLKLSGATGSPVRPIAISSAHIPGIS